MPGNVNNALSSTVLSLSLCSAFTEDREFRVREGQYADGSDQRLSDATVSQKRFKLAKRLAAAQWIELRDFYLVRRCAIEAFYFYFGLETVPLFSHDPTGQNPTGRYTVRFEGDFPVELGVGRIAANITLIEIA